MSLTRFKSISLWAALAVTVPVIPLVLVVLAAMGLDANSWWRLLGGADAGFTLDWFEGKAWRLILNTLWLALLTACFSLSLAMPAAVLIARYEFWGRRWLSRLLVLPVAIPPYLFAVIYSDIHKVDVLFGWQVRDIFTAFNLLIQPLTPGYFPANNGVYGFVGAALILSFAGYPYVYLLLKQRLQRENSHWQDSARLLNVSRITRFFTISLPWFRPALIAGLTVVLLHVLADYGTVKVLRVETFTKEIFKYIDDLPNYQMAAALSVLLLGLGSTVVALGWLGQTQRSAKDSQQAYPRQHLPLSKSLLAYGGLAILILPTVLVPLVWLLYWSITVLQPQWSWIVVADLLQSTGDSLGFALAATVVAMLLGFILSYYRWLFSVKTSGFSGQWHKVASHGFISLGTLGFVLPGPIVALGLLMVSQMLPATLSGWFSGSYLLFVLALTVRYLPIAIQGEQAALAGFSPRLLEAAQLQGIGRLTTLWRVLLPAIRPSLFAASVLSAIEILKDLPIALIIRPLGVSTLPMDIWNEFGQETVQLAAPAALMLVLLSLPLVIILDRRGSAN